MANQGLLNEILRLIRRDSDSGAPQSYRRLSEETGLSVGYLRKLVGLLISSGLVLVVRRGLGRPVDLQAGDQQAGFEALPLLRPKRPFSSGGSVPERSPDVPPGPGRSFEPGDMDRMMIALPLAELLQALESGNASAVEEMRGRFRMSADGRISLVIDLSMDHPGGLGRARQRVFDLLVRVAGAEVSEDADKSRGRRSRLDRISPMVFREASAQYVFAWLRPAQIRRLAALELAQPQGRRAVFRLWPDNLVERLAYSSLPTIKADAATATFGCSGREIVWAVVDSGIDASHPHFAEHDNLGGLPSGVSHVDFVEPERPAPLRDDFGHGTHVAGIIAGHLRASDPARPLEAVAYERDQNDAKQALSIRLAEVSGVAPECKLVSLKVLDDRGKGGVTGVIAALEEVYRANGYGKFVRVHGVNLSLGYPFNPRWFACGHSPLCEVVDRLARSGVVVVAAAGNNGFGYLQTSLSGTWAQGLPMSITDPGNAERAITVGSTHRDAPHTYGVSYFSSKGPTGDGRCKPDLLAPGEKVISCAAGAQDSGAAPSVAAGAAPLYREDSGTSMAAPHVSGAIAAFLSVRREFIGRADAVKEVFLSSALDLKRNRDMQGHGLLDLLRALQSV